jgi:hypothetical protein
MVQLLGVCEHSDELPVSIATGNFSVNYQLFKDCVPWIMYLISVLLSSLITKLKLGYVSAGRFSVFTIRNVIALGMVTCSIYGTII